MQKSDGRMCCTCLDILLLFFLLRFSSHELYKHNCKAVHFPGASIKFQQISSISKGSRHPAEAGNFKNLAYLPWTKIHLW